MERIDEEIVHAIIRSFLQEKERELERIGKAGEDPANMARTRLLQIAWELIGVLKALTAKGERKGE